MRRRADRVDWTFPCLISHYFYKLPQRRRSSHPSQFPHLTLHVGTKRSAILIILVIERIFCYPRESQTPIPWHLCPDVTYGYYAPGKHALAIDNRPVSPTSRTGANSTRWLVLTYYCLLGIAQNVGWSQISSAADASKQLFGRETTGAQLEALLSWGPWGVLRRRADRNRHVAQPQATATCCQQVRGSRSDSYVAWVNSILNNLGCLALLAAMAACSKAGVSNITMAAATVMALILTAVAREGRDDDVT